MEGKLVRFLKFYCVSSNYSNVKDGDDTLMTIIVVVYKQKNSPVQVKEFDEERWNTSFKGVYDFLLKFLVQA